MVGRRMQPFTPLQYDPFDVVGGASPNQQHQKGRIATVTLVCFHTSKMESAFDGGVFIAVGAVNSIFADAFGVFGADGVWFGVGRVGGADEVAKIFNSVVFFEDGSHDGTAAHEFGEFAIEGAFFVDFVKFAGFFEAEFGEFHCHDAEACGVDHLKDVADVACAHRVGLDHREGAFACHGIGVTCLDK